MKQALALFLAVTIAALSGCGGSGSSAAPASAVAPAVPSSAVSAVSEAVSNAASPSATRTFTDSAGRTVEIPAAPSRIAPSGPLAQIALFALAPDQLVCLSTKWDKRSTEYIGAAYLQLPVVGQLYGTKGTLNLEGLAAVEPQLVIDIGEAKKTVAEDMDALQKQVGVPTVFIEATTATMGDAYRMLGELLGMPDKAKVLADYCDEIYGKTTALMQTVGESKAKILYCLGESGSSVIANGSYHAEVLDLLSDNVAVLDNPTSKGTGNEVDFEQLYQWKPEVILFAPDGAYAKVEGDPRWQE
ncbi:MAG: ABC transporter substrate-binding protein, partial [Oscillospiraceae bacterium]